MRARLTVPILLVVVQLAAQQAPAELPTVSAISQRMSSSKMDEREKAFDEGSRLLASEKTAPRDVERLRLGVIQLLTAENDRNNISDDEAAKLADEERAKVADGCDHGDNYAGDEEEDADDPSTAYMHRLIAIVVGFNDERAIPALLTTVALITAQHDCFSVFPKFSDLQFFSRGVRDASRFGAGLAKEPMRPR